MAPISTPPKHVLDIATGTGIWEIQFAKQYPDAKVVGADLSLIQPYNVPSNVSFLKENSEKDDWVFSKPFDFIRMRLVLTCFDDHRTVIRKAFENLEPGVGWMEVCDPDFELLSPDNTADGTAFKRWYDLVVEGGANAGRDVRVAKKYKQMLLDAGFCDVVEEVVPMPGQSIFHYKHCDLSTTENARKPHVTRYNQSSIEPLLTIVIISHSLVDRSQDVRRGKVDTLECTQSFASALEDVSQCWVDSGGN